MFRIQDGIVLQELKSALAARRTNLKSPSPRQESAEALAGPAARLLKLFVELPEARLAIHRVVRDEDLAGTGVEGIWRVARDLAEGGMTYGRLDSRLTESIEQDLLLRLAWTTGAAGSRNEAADFVCRRQSV